MLRKPLSRSLAAFLSTTLVATSIQVPTASAAPDALVPPTLGFVSSESRGTGRVILIQDLHLHYPTQKQILGILQHLQSKGQIQGAIGVEGTEGTYDLTRLASYPAGSAKQKAVDYFMKNGELSADEAFAVLSGNGKLLYGIDHAKYYGVNRELFRQTLARRKPLMDKISRIQEEISLLKKKHYTSRLRQLDRQDAYDADAERLLNEKIAAAPSTLVANIVRADHAMALVQRLLAQQVTKGEAGWLAQRLPAIAQLTNQLLAPNHLRLPQAELEETLGSAIDFYTVALMRDVPMATNALELLKKNGGQLVMIVGGFHTEGLTQAFKKAGVGYAVVTPNLRSEPDGAYHNLYEKRLAGERLSTAQVLADWGGRASAGSMALGSSSSDDAVRVLTSLSGANERLWSLVTYQIEKRRRPALAPRELIARVARLASLKGRNATAVSDYLTGVHVAPVEEQQRVWATGFAKAHEGSRVAREIGRFLILSLPSWAMLGLSLVITNNPPLSFVAAFLVVIKTAASDPYSIRLHQAWNTVVPERWRLSLDHIVTVSIRGLILELTREHIEEARRHMRATIFGGYDIRGVADDQRDQEPTLTPAMAFLIGQAIGTKYFEIHGDERRPRFLVTGDNRLSTPGLLAALIEGLREAGVNVEFSQEEVPTGATTRKALTGDYDGAIQTTGSHNPPDNNGFKIQMKQRTPDGSMIPSALFGLDLASLYPMILDNHLRTAPLRGIALGISGVVMEYINELDEVTRRRIETLTNTYKFVVDVGNGVGAPLIALLERQRVRVAPLFADSDGRFPNHPADPSKDKVSEPYAKSGVRYAVEHVLESNKWGDSWAGFTLDGDGDRFGAIDEAGNPIAPERVLLVLYQRFILENLAGIRKIEAAGGRVRLAFDVRSSGVIKDLIAAINNTHQIHVEGVFIPAGYPSHRAFVRRQILEIKQIFRSTLGLLGDQDVQNVIDTYTSAEASGHYFYATAPDSRYPDLMIDDGIFTAVKLLQIVDTYGTLEARQPNSPLPVKDRYTLHEIFSSLPKKPVTTDIRVVVGSVDGSDPHVIKKAVVGEVETIVKERYRSQATAIIDRQQIDDGVRVELNDGSWFLIRYSNTGAQLTLKVEAETQERLVELMGEVRAILEPYVSRGIQLSDYDNEYNDQKTKGQAMKANNENKSLTLDVSNALTAAIGKPHGLMQEEWSSVDHKLQKAHAKLTEQARDYGEMVKVGTAWRKSHEQADDIAAVKAVAADILRAFEAGEITDFVVLGIGGSDLGARALHEALRGKFYNGSRHRKGPRIHFIGDNVSPEDLNGLLSSLDLKKTIVNVVSKSGTTPEPYANYVVIRDQLKKEVGDDWGRHIVATTGLNKKSELFNEHEAMKAKGQSGFRALLPVPDGVGGRFSVFSPVGLLYAGVAGLNIDQLMAGLKRAEARANGNPLDTSNVAYTLAKSVYLMDTAKGVSRSNFYVFDAGLDGVGRWYQQGHNESLGKTRPDGSRTRTQVQAFTGTRDNHSSWQRIKQGFNDNFLIFTRVLRFKNDIIVPAGKDGDLAYMDGLKMGEHLLAAAQQGTEQDAVNAQVPSVTITLEEKNEINVADYMYTLMMSWAILGELYEINAFDQPGVEGYKIETKKRLLDIRNSLGMALSGVLMLGLSKVYALVTAGAVSTKLTVVSMGMGIESLSSLSWGLILIGLIMAAYSWIQTIRSNRADVAKGANEIARKLSGEDVDLTPSSQPAPRSNSFWYAVATFIPGMSELERRFFGQNLSIATQRLYLGISA